MRTGNVAGSICQALLTGRRNDLSRVQPAVARLPRYPTDTRGALSTVPIS
jgi:hypothetical protein